MYSAKVLADSRSPAGVRLTTLLVTFPRFILAEVNTHRMLSRNSASSRAIPTEKMIERVRENPFIPETFNKRVKGMGVGEAFSEREQEAARAVWLNAAHYAAQYADQLAGLGLDKSRANRLLEPFLWHTAIISATEWSNFFALRDHEAAQPEFRIVAKLMRKAMEDSMPVSLEFGQWHLPLINEDELRASQNSIEDVKLVSAGRCARVSYDTHENYEPPAASIARAEVLKGNGHMSPCEHVARPFAAEEWAAVSARKEVLQVELWRDQDSLALAQAQDACEFSGNFRGWVQMRKEIPHESDFAELEAANAG